MPVNVAVAPTAAHMDVGDDDAVTVGLGLTDMLTTAELVQVPFAPRTVYVVFTLGVTTTLDPVKLPGFQVYVVAPPAVKVVWAPAQITVGLALAVTVGFGLTVKASVLVLVQLLVVPVTVYTVFATGDTVTLEPVKLPGFQVYVVAPVELSVAVLPKQMAVGDAIGFKVGVGLTEILTTACAVQLPEVPLTV